MTWFIPLSTTGAGEVARLGVNDDIFVGAGVVLAATNYVPVILNLGDPRAIVHGTLVGTWGLYSYGTDGASVTIGATGRITGHRFQGYYDESTGTTVRNHGVIETLEPTYATIQFNAVAADSNWRVVNDGLIEGQNYGIQVIGTTPTFRLDNSGTVKGSVWSFQDEAGSTDTVINTGRMVGNVILGGGNDRFDGRGGRLDGEVFGGAGRDRLISGADSDRMHGGTGQDVLTGGGGADRFVFDVTPGSGNADVITDFDRNDRIWLQDTNFRVLPQGALAAGAFRANASGLAIDGNDRIIYETDTGWLRYDVDGRGGSAGFRFAHLDAHLSMNAGDFFVI